MESSMHYFKQTVEWAGLAIETAGVIIIVVGALLTAVRYATHYRQLGSDDAYERLRRGLGRSIMVGLEFLVAGDIVRTVVVEQSFESLGLLSIVVAIRTFLSLSLYVEVEGRWPWQARRGAEP